MQKHIDEMKGERRKLFVQLLRARKVRKRLAIEVFGIDPLSEKIARFRGFKNELTRTNFVPIRTCRTCSGFCGSFVASRSEMNHIIQHSHLMEPSIEELV